MSLVVVFEMNILADIKFMGKTKVKKLSKFTLIYKVWNQ